MIAETLKRAVMALVVGLVAGWFTTLRPVLAERDAIEPRMHALNQRLEAHQHTAAGLAEQRRAFEALRDAIRQHPMRLPSRPDESGLISRITALAADSDIRIVDIAPGETGETPRYHHRDISVRMQGPWDSLMRLLTEIDATTRAVALTGLELERAETGDARQRLALGLHLRGYWQPGPADDTAVIAEDSDWTLAAATVDGITIAPSLHRDPFHPAIDAERAKRPDIAYLGRIMRGNAQWALIRDADGQLQRRRIGDGVPGLGRLTRIQSQAITVEPETPDNTGRLHTIHRHSSTRGTGD